MRFFKRITVIFMLLILSQSFLIGEDGVEDKENQRQEKYVLKHVEVKYFLRLLEGTLKNYNPLILEGTNSFLLTAEDSIHREVREYIQRIDLAQNNYAVELKYIKSEELLRYLPPSVSREEVVISSNPNIIFFKGSEHKYQKFLKELEVIDKPESQIRYQLLVVQYERSENLNWAKSLSVNKRE